FEARQFGIGRKSIDLLNVHLAWDHIARTKLHSPCYPHLVTNVRYSHIMKSLGNDARNSSFNRHGENGESVCASVQVKGLKHALHSSSTSFCWGQLLSYPCGKFNIQIRRAASAT